MKKVHEDLINNNIKICGVSVWRIFAYFVIYSFLGYILEVLFGMITEGVIQSRQSFMYGPFCTIYGFGAVLMLLPLKKVDSQNRIINFFLAGVIGCLVEYSVSLFGEKVLHTKWWDYTDYFLNIHGRTCLYFGILWGVLGMLLIDFINPRVDFLIEKLKEFIPKKRQKIMIILSNLLLVVDLAVSTIAVDLYQTRAIVENDIDVIDYKRYERHYQEIYRNEKVKNRIMATWGDEVMIKTFPNLKITDVRGEVIYLNTFYPNINNYYFKVFDKKNNTK